jgi:outer membrane receptor protein involved in Fe transport
MKYPALVLVVLLTSVVTFAQTEGARISGRVTDQRGAVIAGAECKITNVETNVSTSTSTNDDGIYVIPDLRPATYRLIIQKEGFRKVIQPSLQLYVQDAVNENFTLAIGLASESITVLGDPLQTDSATVSTVVDQQFVENMPLNGRSFQSLISLAPGVVYVSGLGGAGDFSVNGQRSDANYFMVDGVSVNFVGSTTHFSGTQMGGTGPAVTSGGGTNGLVSIDAMQEFRIQTSTYAPEVGRSPGAQVSIVTKSGTNLFHGTAFDYLRNDVFDARNWFDFAQPNPYYGNLAPLPKPPLRQNDFGGTFSGPIIKDRTFFFFSYEGLRLRLPQTAFGLFYTASARAAASPSFQPFINALPLPPANAPLSDPTCQTVADPSGCTAPLTVAYSDPSSLNATSLRIDHNLTRKITLFARYNHAPSYDASRYWEELEYTNSNIDTFTAGATFLISPTKVNDFRANWSRNTAYINTSLTNFHGAVVPPNSILYPAGSSYRPGQSQSLVLFPDGNDDMEVRDGTLGINVQRQLNFVDTLSWTVGVHQLKFGIDYRRLNPTVGAGNSYFAEEFGFPSIQNGTADLAFLTAEDGNSIEMNNYSLFAQDTWKTTRKLTLTYGLRWEVNTPPASTTSAKPLYVIQGVFDSNPLALVPGSPWHTKFNNFAPRFGAAYQVTPKTVVRGGFGLFYDLGYGDEGEAVGQFPYGRHSTSYGVPFDPASQAFQPLPFTTDITVVEAQGVSLHADDPNLQLPFTMQWNAAIEREVGARQTLQATYVGSDGRRLLRTDFIIPPQFLAGGAEIQAQHNSGYSHYNALQVQFQRRMAHGLQALVSYNLSKSSDLGSYVENGFWASSVSQVVLPPLTPSDFDIRQSLSGAVSYELPAPAWGKVGHAVLKGWAVDGLLRVTSVPPLNVTIGTFLPAIGSFITQPDVVAGQPYWIANSNEPGGKALNPAAFTRSATGTGNSPRNGIRNIYGSIDQTDLALRRRFNLTERVKLDVRAECFNIFNHPMFGAPGLSGGVDGLSAAPWNFWGYGPTPSPLFGKVYPGYTTNVAANATLNGGGQNPLYAVGGPRSGQFTLKVMF